MSRLPPKPWPAGAGFGSRPASERVCGISPAAGGVRLTLCWGAELFAVQGLRFRAVPGERDSSLLTAKSSPRHRWRDRA